MTKPRDNPDRELFGILGSLPDTSECKRYFNHRFEEEDIDAFLDHYPTKPEELPERLSEMFHFDRRGYIVADALSEAIIPLLDQIDGGVGDRVTLVMNRGGILTGYAINDYEKVWDLWFTKE